MISLKDLIVQGAVYTIREAVEAALAEKQPWDVLEILVTGIREAGDQYQEGEIFLPELMRSAETFKEAMAILEPALGDKKRQKMGKIVLGTVRGDVHNLGKNIVGLMLDGAGFEVVDLGIDVAPEAFVTAVKEHQPQLVGMSALITTTMLEMEKTIKALEAAGLRKTVAVMIGGAPVSLRFAQTIGADAYARDAVEAVDKAISLIQKK
ncbi:MAG: corrinoid protein [Candidatus Hodarchaeota archaeon]